MPGGGELRIKRILSLLVIYLFLVTVLIFSLYPILWTVVTSLKTSIETIKNPYSLPETIQWANYAQAWVIGRFGTYSWNSILITVPTVLLITTLATMTSYALSKLKLFGVPAILLFFLLGLMVPFHGFMIPMYYQLRDLDLLNTRWGVILALTALALPFAVYLMRSAIIQVPDELIESARLDGANPIQILLMVVTPLIRPTLVALVVIQSIWAWNEFLIPLLILHKDSLRTVQIGLTFFQTRFSTDFALTAAGTVIILAPLIVVYLAFQRHFVKGILSGGVKS